MRSKGAAAAPFLTVNRAVKELTAGDTVLVREGVYEETTPGEYSAIGCNHGGLGVWLEGIRREPGRPIALRAYPGENVKLTAKGASCSIPTTWSCRTAS